MNDDIKNTDEYFKSLPEWQSANLSNNIETVVSKLQTLQPNVTTQNL